MKKALKFVAQLILLCAVSWLGNQIALLSGLPIPGNVFGMILLFCLLCLGVIKLHYIQQAADFLLKHMLFFFVPIAVGLMNWGQLFYDHALVLAAAVIIGAVVPFWLVGFLAQYSAKEENRCSN
ncbi:MAG: CidA/LrgA family protein [Sporomusaceae bacterium]|nr:CidA/LrgA family protein [Sporomusaceae bacterium]